jgi:hypothetical protein
MEWQGEGRAGCRGGSQSPRGSSDRANSAPNFRSPRRMSSVTARMHRWRKYTFKIYLGLKKLHSTPTHLPEKRYSSAEFETTQCAEIAGHRVTREDRRLADEVRLLGTPIASFDRNEYRYRFDFYVDKDSARIGRDILCFRSWRLPVSRPVRRSSSASNRSSRPTLPRRPTFCCSAARFNLGRPKRGSISRCAMGSTATIARRRIIPIEAYNASQAPGSTSPAFMLLLRK